MAKKPKKPGRHKFRNAMRPTRAPATRPIPHTSSSGGTERAKPPVDPPGLRTIKAAGGAIGAALACAYIARENWIPPKVVTGLVAAVGGTAAVIADNDTYRSIGQGVMSAAGAQLGLMLIDSHYQTMGGPAGPLVATVGGKKPANAESLPPGALEAAYERARRRLAMSEAASQMAT
jgi:hypothetical protein